MESRHCGQDNASTPCSLQAFGIRCIAQGSIASQLIGSNISSIIPLPDTPTIVLNTGTYCPV